MANGIISRRGSGGGAGLNLRVVGGTVQPADPKENTIWLNTDTEISGYAFSAAQPENPTEGMAWFKTDTSASAPINVDKKNTVMLYPTGCKQYVNSEWVDKTALTYFNAQWVEWLDYYYLYNKGEQYASVTGGWKVAGSAVLEDSAILIQGSSTNDRAYTNTYIQFGSWKTLYVTIEDFNGGTSDGSLTILLVNSGGSSITNLYTKETGEVAVPVDNVTSKCQIWFRCASSAYMSARITKVKLV